METTCDPATHSITNPVYDM